MAARFLSSGKWAIVFSIIMGWPRVVVVLSRVARLDTVLRPLAGWKREEILFGLDLGLSCRQGPTTSLLGGPDGSTAG